MSGVLTSVWSSVGVTVGVRVGTGVAVGVAWRRWQGGGRRRWLRGGGWHLRRCRVYLLLGWHIDDFYCRRGCRRCGCRGGRYGRVRIGSRRHGRVGMRGGWLLLRRILWPRRIRGGWFGRVAVLVAVGSGLLVAVGVGVSVSMGDSDNPLTWNAWVAVYEYPPAAMSVTVNVYVLDGQWASIMPGSVTWPSSPPSSSAVYWLAPPSPVPSQSSASLLSALVTSAR